MVIFHLHRRDERTCNSCGYRWVVTRRQANLHAVARRSRLRAGGPQSYYSANAVSSFEGDLDSQVELVESYRRCGRCGVDDFSERPLGGNGAQKI